MTRISVRLTVVLLVLFLAGFVPEPLPAPPTVAAQPVFTPVLRPVVTGLVKPLFVTHAGDGSGRQFIVEQGGTIRVLTGGQIPATPFLDLRSRVVTGSEQGLLGLAFDPSFGGNRRAYVFYTAAGSPTGVGDNTLARYILSVVDPNRLDPVSGTILLAIPDPFGNHNGGMLAFGPDRFLYVGTGDGGSAGDPNNNGQNLAVLLGKLLRLDVSGGGTYAIPPSNPYASRTDGTRREIWASGLRNPWRFSFDRQTGDLFVADVGQGSREEIDRQAAGSAGGQNYGWRIMEGFGCFNPSSGCNQSGLTLPIFDYGHGEGCSVTGGYVYRGSALPALQGAYVFGDFCSGTIWTLRLNGGTWTRSQLLDTTFSISSFGEDEAGELYLTDLAGGRVYRLADAATAPPPVVAAPALPPIGVGGKGLGISPQVSTVRLDWAGGGDQLGYLLVRDPEASAVLAAGAMAYTDAAPAPPPALGCYVLVPFGSAGPLGVSDALCAQQGLASPVGAPPGFTLRLNQSSTASLSWVNPPGTIGSVLVALPLDGSPPRYQPLAASTTTATDATGGAFTCYMLVAGTLFGQINTDLACGLPGVSTLGAAALSQPRTAGTGPARAATTGPESGAAVAEQARVTAERRIEVQWERHRPHVEQLGPKVQEALREAKQRLTRSPRR